MSALLSVLVALFDAAEAYASSEPDMPSHAQVEAEFDAALEAARIAIQKEGVAR
jgi:hypothetical protein